MKSEEFDRAFDESIIKLSAVRLVQPDVFWAVAKITTQKVLR